MSDTLHETPGGAPAPTPDPAPSTATTLRKAWSVGRWIGVIISVLVLIFALVLLVVVMLGSSSSSGAGAANQPAAQPTTPKVSQPAAGPTPTFGSDNTLAAAPRPDPKDLRATAQWFEDTVLLGVKKQDPRYFLMVTGGSDTQAYASALSAMTSNAQSGVFFQKATITSFKVTASAGDFFQATYNVRYDAANVQVEKIQAINLVGKWYLSIIDYPTS